MPKKIPLQTWAERHYDPVPSSWVLRRWARDGEITPAAERVGREWYVLETAIRVAPSEPEQQEQQAPVPGQRRLTLVERIEMAEAQGAA